MVGVRDRRAGRHGGLPVRVPVIVPLLGAWLRMPHAGHRGRRAHRVGDEGQDQQQAEEQGGHRAHRLRPRGGSFNRRAFQALRFTQRGAPSGAAAQIRDPTGTEVAADATGAEALQAAMAARLVARVPALGAALARCAFDAGLAVTRPDGTRRPIPVGAIPVVLEDDEVARRHRLAAVLVAATAKAARWRLAGPQRQRTLAALSPAERRLVEASAQQPLALAVARIDFLGDPPLALEANATIPAMQGYSDIAARAWLETFADARDVEALSAANGSNETALLEALLALHRDARGGRPDSIALLARPGDAQRTELLHLAAAFSARGLQAELVEPGQLRFEAGWLWRGAQRIELVYRHLFLSRLDAAPCDALEAALRNDAQGTLVLNPPAPHLEMKSTLAVLSHALQQPSLADAIGLGNAELDAIAQCVPWTRRLDEVDREELERVVSEPDHFVLKRSWSYGGQEVFVGRARGEAGFARRAAQVFPQAGDWPALVRAAAADRAGDGFVVQRAADVRRTTQWLCTPEGARRDEVVTDYAAYASLGTSPAWGGVCRAAASDVVNIVGGGGVVPLLRAGVARRWLRSEAGRPD
jgi:hypothetical protein